MTSFDYCYKEKNDKEEVRTLICWPGGRGQPANIQSAIRTRAAGEISGKLATSTSVHGGVAETPAVVVRAITGVAAREAGGVSRGARPPRPETPAAREADGERKTQRVFSPQRGKLTFYFWFWLRYLTHSAKVRKSHGRVRTQRTEVASETVPVLEFPLIIVRVSPSALVCRGDFCEAVAVAGFRRTGAQCCRHHSGRAAQVVP